MVAGVQKSATSALHHYLRQHPHLQLPEKKELHFFDNEALNWKSPPYEKYHEAFDITSSGRLKGECTPIYTYWLPSLPRTHSYYSGIKLIICLRDPVARAYSHWRMEVVRNRESLGFSQAIREGRTRVSAVAKPKGQHRVFSYVERGFYASQMERVLEYFPRDQILILTRMGVMHRQRETLDSICRFLEVPMFREYPPPRIVHSYAAETMAAPLPMDVQYLRRLFTDDLAITESLINVSIEPEYP